MFDGDGEDSFRGDEVEVRALGSRAFDIARDTSREQALARIRALQKEPSARLEIRSRGGQCTVNSVPSEFLDSNVLVYAFTGDALLIAAALRANCRILWPDDMRDGPVVQNRLHLSNPFRQVSLSALLGGEGGDPSQAATGRVRWAGFGIGIPT